MSFLCIHYVCLSPVQQAKIVNGSNAGLSSSEHSNAVKGHTATRVPNRPSNTSVSSRPHPHTFYRQVQLLPFNNNYNWKSFKDKKLIFIFPSPALFHFLLLWTSGFSALSTATNSAFSPSANHYFSQFERSERPPASCRQAGVASVS